MGLITVTAGSFRADIFRTSLQVLVIMVMCHCKFSASMTDCGAILNSSAFPECLWLIWHFCLNPKSLDLQPAVFLPLCVSLHHLSLAFHCSHSRLPLFKHPPSPFPITQHAQRHFVSLLSHLFKHSSGVRQSISISYLSSGMGTLHRKYRVKNHCQWLSVYFFLSSYCGNLMPTSVVALSCDAVVCFQLIKFEI